MSSTVTQQRSMDLLGYLFLLFTGLKLTGHIDWSWWLVTGPLWIPASITAAAMLVIYGVDASLRWAKKGKGKK